MYPPIRRFITRPIQTDAPLISLDWTTGEITMTNPNSSGTIYYTVNSTNPTANSTAYTNPFIADDLPSITYRAIVVDNNIQSAVTTVTYTRCSVIAEQSISYATGQHGIQLSTVQENGVVRITQDDTVPTYNSEDATMVWLYTNIYASRTVRHRGFCEGYLPSSPLYYTWGGEIPSAPAIEFDSGTNTVTISRTGNTVYLLPSLYNIYYTLDGTEPTASSTLYEGPFTLNNSATIKAVLVAFGEYYSAVTTEEIIITEPAVYAPDVIYADHLCLERAGMSVGDYLNQMETGEYTPDKLVKIGEVEIDGVMYAKYSYQFSSGYGQYHDVSEDFYFLLRMDFPFYDSMRASDENGLTNLEIMFMNASDDSIKYENYADIPAPEVCGYYIVDYESPTVYTVPTTIYIDNDHVVAPYSSSNSNYPYYNSISEYITAVKNGNWHPMELRFTGTTEIGGITYNCYAHYCYTLAANDYVNLGTFITYIPSSTIFTPEMQMYVSNTKTYIDGYNGYSDHLGQFLYDIPEGGKHRWFIISYTPVELLPDTVYSPQQIRIDSLSRISDDHLHMTLSQYLSQYENGQFRPTILTKENDIQINNVDYTKYSCQYWNGSEYVTDSGCYYIIPTSTAFTSNMQAVISNTTTTFQGSIIRSDNSFIYEDITEHGEFFIVDYTE